jgi:hypothetical protein
MTDYISPKVRAWLSLNLHSIKEKIAQHSEQGLKKYIMEYIDRHETDNKSARRLGYELETQLHKELNYINVHISYIETHPEPQESPSVKGTFSVKGYYVIRMEW